MSERDSAPGDLLRRWSRRKRAAEAQSREADQVSESGSVKTSAPPRSVEPDTPESPVSDPAILPPIETITAATDIRGFLAPGVPVELSRAALRRAWMTDPAIRDFVGLAENQWDFTKPDAVPGFGALELTPQMRRIIHEFVTSAANEAAPGRNADSQRVVRASQKLHEETSLAMDQTADTRVAGLGDAGQSTAQRVPSVVRSSLNAAAIQRDSEAASGDQALAHRKHGGALPK